MALLFVIVQMLPKEVGIVTVPPYADVEMVPEDPLLTLSCKLLPPLPKFDQLGLAYRVL